MAKEFAYWLDLNVTDGSAVDKDFDPPMDRIAVIKYLRDVELTDEEKREFEMERVIRITERRRKNGAPEIFGYNGGEFYVSERVKNIIENLDPGRYEFKDYKVYVFGEYVDKFYGSYYLIKIQRLNCVDVEKTDFWERAGLEGYYNSKGELGFMDNDKCFLKKEIVYKQNLWQTQIGYGHEKMKVGGNVYVFCFQELKDIIKKEKIDEWKFYKKCELI